MRALLPVALALCACATHDIPRVQWPQLGKYKPTNPVLVDTVDGIFYVTPKVRLTFVIRDGREITRRWQEITVAKNSFTAISVDREVFNFGLSDVKQVVAHGKLVGELTGVIPETRATPGPPTGPMGGMRPMVP